ncbi:MAG: hypothetical protein CL610_21600 [Anaerolineaceae bacterium]|nr:hypothetical protein [Anaerolineaceae bacterium]
MPYHLAQLNVGYAVAPLDDPVMADFMDNLVRINQLGSETPGFVWQMVNDSGDSTSFRFDNDADMLINMTVWESIEALYDFAYKSEHVDYFRRRREWFVKMDRPYLVLWWVPAGHQPTLAEAAKRLAHLEAHGPTPYAFTFKQRFMVEDLLRTNSAP